MSCELETSITIRGTQEQLLAMLKVLQTFGTEGGYTSYLTSDGKEGRTQWWLGGVHIWDHSTEKIKSIFLSGMTEEELNALAEKAGGSLDVFADGPSGAAFEANPFEQLAEAVPDGEFSGRIEGIMGGEDVYRSAEYADGHLELYERSHEDYLYEEYGICEEDY